MKKITSILTICAALLSFSSCFKDEEPNSECDITKAWVHVDNPKEVFFQVSDSAINVLYSKDDIEFVVRSKADITKMAPRFVITPGATITPANGSVQDFSAGPVVYTVKSEDGAWSRKYKVSFKPQVIIKADTLRFDFEDYRIYESDGVKFYRWYETELSGSKIEYWANANAGFAMAKGTTSKPEDYPTYPVDGYQGKGVALTTRDTGFFGSLTNRRLAAGNFFIGEFDTEPALSETLKCTHMGRPFISKPVSFSGYYQYTPGKQMQNKAGKPIEGVDSAAVYAVLYLNHDEAGKEVMLYGDSIKTSRHIVAIADLKDVKHVKEWTKFEVRFDYMKKVDYELLENRGYNLAIVFSSSKNGDFYEGAIGSTLLIDHVSIACEKEE